jgi:toxin YoeB
VNITFTPRGWEHYLYWQASDPRMLARINALLQDMARSPFKGIGKPEPLRENWAGWWSRRIDGEHRLVYRVIGKEDDQRLEITQCRYHY